MAKTFELDGVTFAPMVEAGAYVWRSACGRMSVGHGYHVGRRYYWAEVDGRRGTNRHADLKTAMRAAVQFARRSSMRAAA